MANRLVKNGTIWGERAGGPGAGTGTGAGSGTGSGPSHGSGPSKACSESWLSVRSAMFPNLRWTSSIGNGGGVGMTDDGHMLVFSTPVCENGFVTAKYVVKPAPTNWPRRD